MPDINAAYQWAINVCNDPNVRYSQSYREHRTINGLTYYDCSSFIYYALRAGGWNLPDGQAFSTRSEEATLQRLGWHLVADGSVLPGDIGWKSGHTEMAYSSGSGNTAVFMGAHGQNGIAGPNQVSIGTSSGGPSSRRSFTHIWRYGSSGAKAIGNAAVSNSNSSSSNTSGSSSTTSVPAGTYFSGDLSRWPSANVQWIDTYTNIYASFNTSDGIHYDKDTYKKIYNLITGTITNDAKAIQGAVLSKYLNIDWKKFNPYVLIVDQGSKFQIEQVSKHNVVAFIIEAGWLYSSGTQTVRSVFDNPELSIILNRNKSLKSPLPYGMFMYARAKSADQAKEEMYWFSFPVRKYNPQLGIWFQLDINNVKSINDQCLQRYYDDGVRLGFKSKMGIICTKKILKTISWENKWSEKFFLITIDHVTKESDIQKLFDPSFFDTDNKG